MNVVMDARDSQAAPAIWLNGLLAPLQSWKTTYLVNAVPILSFMKVKNEVEHFELRGNLDISPDQEEDFNWLELADDLAFRQTVRRVTARHHVACVLWAFFNHIYFHSWCCEMDWLLICCLTEVGGEFLSLHEHLHIYFSQDCVLFLVEFDFQLVQSLDLLDLGAFGRQDVIWAALVLSDALSDWDCACEDLLHRLVVLHPLHHLCFTSQFQPIRFDILEADKYAFVSSWRLRAVEYV